MPCAWHSSIQASHFRKTLNDAARRDHRHDRSTSASAIDESCDHAEPSGVDVVDARQIERDVRCRRLVDVRRPQFLICTLAENQSAACPYDDSLCLAERRQRKLTLPR
jgi:hypothetical protein